MQDLTLALSQDLTLFPIPWYLILDLVKNEVVWVRGRVRVWTRVRVKPTAKYHIA
jgi:hypothetical protein